MSPLNYGLLELCADGEVVGNESDYQFSSKASNLITAEIIQTYGKSSDQSDFLGGVLQDDSELPSYAINALRDMSDTNLKKLALRVLDNLTEVCVVHEFPEYAEYDNLGEWCDHE